MRLPSRAARIRDVLRVASLAVVLSAASGCSHLPASSADALVLELPAVRQPPDRCGPAMLSSVYRYWGRATTEAEVAARVFNQEAGGTLPGMLVADARRHGWRAAFGPGDPVDWQRALAARVPVICLRPGSEAGHFVILQGHDHDRFLVNDGSGRLRWTTSPHLSGPDAVSIYVWPDDYGFDPPPVPSHDLTG